MRKEDDDQGVDIEEGIGDSGIEFLEG